VGLGGYGMESLKTLVWYGQMDGYRLKIDAFDRDAHASARVAYLCPEIMDERYNHQYVSGEACYSVRVHDQMEVGTDAFVRETSKLTEASFVLVSLGNDDLNIETAVSLRALFERMHIKPTIYAVVHNDRLAECLKDLTNYRGQPYCIRTIGGLQASYSEKVILHSELEKDALDIHQIINNNLHIFVLVNNAQTMTQPLVCLTHFAIKHIAYSAFRIDVFYAGDRIFFTNFAAQCVIDIFKRIFLHKVSPSDKSLYTKSTMYSWLCQEKRYTMYTGDQYEKD
jgi:hypothetical protein